jgi:hypothetical protein
METVEMPYVMRVNVPLLKQQKRALLKCNMAQREKEGLLNLLDAIQDIAEGI